jgi:CubicO group peptidase (beta-lactamase class C family)
MKNFHFIKAFGSYRINFSACVMALIFMSATVVAQTVENKKAAELLPVDAATIENLIQNQLGNDNVYGASVAVVHRGKIVFAKGYGKRSIEKNQPVDAETVFDVGSVSKQFTSAAVFLLAEEGKLSVSDKVAKYLPHLTGAKDITLLDLMQHTSGYPDYWAHNFLDREKLAPVSADEIINKYATRKLNFEPRTQHSYSNTGYVVLARVIEKVSGKPLGKFLTERFFKPLKMKNTFFEPDKRNSRFAEGYTSYALGDAELALKAGRGWGSGAGGVFSTATDLAKWDLALMEGKALKPESLKLMTARLKLSDGSEKDYGAGVEIYDYSGDTVITHGGATSGFLARNTMIPSTKSALVLLTNVDFAFPGSVLHGKFLNSLLTPKQSPNQPKAAAKNSASPVKPVAIPEVQGIPAAEAARRLFAQMQSGNLDREMLGEEFGYFLNDSRLRRAADKLKPFGEPAEVKILNQGERGGMETSAIQFVFVSGAKLNGSMYRSADGKIQDFSIRK